MIKICKKGLATALIFQVLILIGILMFLTISCDSIFGTSSTEEDTTEEEGEEARVVVSNQYGKTLDIYMDGVFQFTLYHGDDDTIGDVSHDEHYMEAKRKGTSTVVASTEIDVVSDVDYSWYIDDPPDINVINDYGRTLKIYMDGSYMFELVDEEDRWIVDVSFGERFLKAVKASDDTEVASITIDVTENTDYTWTIE